MNDFRSLLTDEIVVRKPLHDRKSFNNAVADIVCVMMSYFDVKKVPYGEVTRTLNKLYTFDIEGETLRGIVYRSIKFYYKNSYIHEMKSVRTYEREGLHRFVHLDPESADSTVRQVNNEKRELHSSMRVAKMTAEYRNKIIETIIRLKE